MRGDSQDARMGHSLPISTDAQPVPRTERERTDAPRVRARPRTEDERAGAPSTTPRSSEAAAPSTGADSFTAAIVRNKVRAPAVRAHTLERPRLLNWLDAHAKKRLRVLTAEAGYGKSTLIADHAKRSGGLFAWYRLEASDVDWVGMLSYIVASIQEVIPDFGAAAVNLLQRVGVLNATRDMVLDVILAELETRVTDRLTLVLDDFHVVQDGEDVRAIINRLVELAPGTLTFILAGRLRPDAVLARPMSHGEVAELGTHDLRFTRAETAYLLENMLGGPLDDDLVQILDERLTGWVASLQLVGTSLIGMRPRQVRTAIEELTVRSEPLYDFLSSQVLQTRSGTMRRVLSVASILERVEPTLVLAAMTGDDRLSKRRIEIFLAQAEASGVISRTASSGRWWRFHPLIRDFASSQLLERTSRRSLLEMHLRVARAAEPLDWAVSAHHYIEADHRADAMRVLRESAIEALGTASWGAATTLADRIPDQPVPEAVTVLRAYTMAAEGQAARAVVLLEGLTPSSDDPLAWGLTRAALANLYLVTGRLDTIRSILEELRQHRGVAPVIASLARGVSVILDTHQGGSLVTASDVFVDMAQEQSRLGLNYFAAVSYHNASLAFFARGQYERSIALGRQAVRQFDRTPSRHGIESTHASLAIAHLELGDADRAEASLECIPSGNEALADAKADSAWVAAAQGDTDTAWILIEQASATARDSARTPGAHAAVQYSRALAHLVDGNLHAAAQAVSAAREGTVELDALPRHFAMSALVGLLSDDSEAAARLAREGLAVAERQRATHWARWLNLIAAVANSDADSARRSLVSLAASAKLSTLVLADAVVRSLGLVGDLPTELRELIRTSPRRWLPVLRRCVQTADLSAGLPAAELLSTFGTIDDVAILRKFELKHIRQPSRRGLSRRLARHANPTLVVHDLGRLQLQVAHRLVPLSQSRRKAASLMAFLASRASHSATRDQVLEAMWPKQVPEGATNSLHQTLFFLRRDIDPWFEDGGSVDYLVMEPDVVYLDPELVQVDSAAFFRQASAALASGSIAELAVPILRDYPAKFALDFEYEDWSHAWREQLHSIYLEAAQGAADALLAKGDVRLAIDVIQRALAVDASAVDLEGALVTALHRAGSTAAAAHQYRHFAKSYEEETGMSPPQLADLITGQATNR